MSKFRLSFIIVLADYLTNPSQPSLKDKDSVSCGHAVCNTPFLCLRTAKHILPVKMRLNLGYI